MASSAVPAREQGAWATGVAVERPPAEAVACPIKLVAPRATATMATGRRAIFERRARDLRQRAHSVIIDRSTVARCGTYRRFGRRPTASGRQSAASFWAPAGSTHPPYVICARPLRVSTGSRRNRLSPGRRSALVVGGTQADCDRASVAPTSSDKAGFETTAIAGRSEGRAGPARPLGSHGEHRFKGRWCATSPRPARPRQHCRGRALRPCSSPETAAACRRSA